MRSVIDLNHVHESGEPRVVLDIGGEGRHAGAWNLNPSPVKTLGPQCGEPIPRHVSGRADAIPLPDSSCGRIIVERTPLLPPALKEIRRVAANGAVVILRHAMPHGLDPHALARRLLGPPQSERLVVIGRQTVQESVFISRK